MTAGCARPEDIVAFWFPDGDAPGAREHQRLWDWRQRGSHDAVVARYAGLTARAVAGDLDVWAQGPVGRLALILVLDAFSRLLWAGTPRAFAAAPKARDLCLQGLANGQFQALTAPWHRAAYRSPLEQCECADPAEHLAHLDTAIALAVALEGQVPAALQPWYAQSTAQSRRHRAVIARFGRYPQRNAILGRSSTAQELAFIASGDLPPPLPAPETDAAVRQRRPRPTGPSHDPSGSPRRRP